MPAEFRKLMILTLALLLLICPALSESAGTLPGYPFPTEVEGYTFVSFADNLSLLMEAELADVTRLPFLVTAGYFETVYPGCSLLQLKDLLSPTGSTPSSSLIWPNRQGPFRKISGSKPYAFSTPSPIRLHLI